MKLSNKILLGFLGIIFLYLSAAFAEIRLTGSLNRFVESNGIAEKTDLSGFTYLVIDSLDENISVIGSDRYALEVRSTSGNVLKKLPYNVSGDTLTLSGFTSGENNVSVRISVFVPDTLLQGITVKSSTVTLKGLRKDFFHISENNARIAMSDNKISKIQMNLVNHSFLNTDRTDMDTALVTIEESQVDLDGVGLLEGLVKNNSTLQADRIQEIHIKKDTDSRLYLAP